MKISIALAPSGELHVIGGEMPPADNLVTVELTKVHGVWRIPRASVERLREILWSPAVGAVVTHPSRDPDLAAADELDEMLTTITLAVRRRIDRLRGDEDEPPTP